MESQKNFESQNRQNKISEEHIVISDGIRYSVDKLIELSRLKESQYIAITELESALHVECWDDSEGNKIKPIDVLNLIKKRPSNLEKMREGSSKLADHINRIFNADTVHPIIIVNIGGEKIVVDGMHRLTKNFLENHRDVPVTSFSEFPEEAKL